MSNKFNFKSDQILNKKFDTEISGYSPIQVDQYLDLILSDYRKYEEFLNAAKTKIENIENLVNDKSENIERLEIEISNFKNALKEAQKHTNHDIMDKLNDIGRNLKK